MPYRKQRLRRLSARRRLEFLRDVCGSCLKLSPVAPSICRMPEMSRQSTSLIPRPISLASRECRSVIAFETICSALEGIARSSAELNFWKNSYPSTSPVWPKKPSEEPVGILFLALQASCSWLTAVPVSRSRASVPHAVAWSGGAERCYRQEKTPLLWTKSSGCTASSSRTTASFRPVCVRMASFSGNATTQATLCPNSSVPGLPIFPI